MLHATLQRVASRTETKLSMLHELAEGSKHLPTSRKKTALLLLRCLHLFARRQFDFFLQGFAPGTGVSTLRGEVVHHGFLQPNAIYTAEYALAHTEQQVDNDFDVLLRIIAHRDEHVGTKDLRDRLARADQLAYLALQPAIEVGLIAPTSVLTYFQKNATVRIIPYAPVALVGIPFTAASGTQPSDSRDYLMIPHEVGHQVYLRLAQPDQNKQTEDVQTLMLQRNVGDYIQQEYIQKHFSQPMPAVYTEQPAWLRNWTEEIFADVYGCLIGGPASARTLQELLKGVPLDVFVADDGAHPSPRIRPYIHMRVLNVLAEKVAAANASLSTRLKSAADTLRQEWEEWCQAQSIPSWLRLVGADSALTVEEVEELVNKVVDGVLDSELHTLVETAATPTSKILWGVPRTPSIEGRPTSEIILDHLPSEPAPELEERGDDRFGWTNDSANEFSPLGTSFKFAEPRDTMLFAGEAKNLPNRHPWWLAVLEAGGWTEVPTGPGSGFKTLLRVS